MTRQAREGLDRFSRYDQRLINEAHRCLRDLEKLRASKEKRGELPASP